MCNAEANCSGQGGALPSDSDPFLLLSFRMLQMILTWFLSTYRSREMGYHSELEEFALAVSWAWREALAAAVVASHLSVEVNPTHREPLTRRARASLPELEAPLC